MAPVPTPRRPLSELERLELLGGLVDVAQRTDALLWAAVDAYLTTGTPADVLAAALGCSRASLYRNLRRHRAGSDGSAAN